MHCVVLHCCTDWCFIERWPPHCVALHRMGSAGLVGVGQDEGWPELWWEDVLSSFLGSILTCPALHQFVELWASSLSGDSLAWKFLVLWQDQSHRAILVEPNTASLCFALPVCDHHTRVASCMNPALDCAKIRVPLSYLPLSQQFPSNMDEQRWIVFFCIILLHRKVQSNTKYPHLVELFNSKYQNRRRKKQYDTKTRNRQSAMLARCPTAQSDPWNHLEEVIVLTISSSIPHKTMIFTNNIIVVFKLMSSFITITSLLHR